MPCKSADLIINWTRNRLSRISNWRKLWRMRFYIRHHLSTASLPVWLSYFMPNTTNSGRSLRRCWSQMFRMQINSLRRWRNWMDSRLVMALYVADSNIEPAIRWWEDYVTNNQFPDSIFRRPRSGSEIAARFPDLLGQISSMEWAHFCHASIRALDWTSGWRIRMQSPTCKSINFLSGDDIVLTRLQYNPVVDQRAQKEWDIPLTWSLKGQLVFGGRAGEPGEKKFQPIEERLFVHGAKA